MVRNTSIVDNRKQKFFYKSEGRSFQDVGALKKIVETATNSQVDKDLILFPWTETDL